MHPRVSVVVTTYNQSAYIGAALKSVFAQSYKPYEIIVVDDGSTDDTAAHIAFCDEQVTYIRQKNQGIAASRNTGIRKARGDYIAFLDGDDLWEPEKLSVQVDVAASCPNSGLIAVDGVMFDEGGIVEGSLFFAPWCKELPEDSVTTRRYYHQLLVGPFIYTTSQVMVPSRVFEIIGLSNGKFKRASDYDLYIRIAAQFDITLIKKRLTRWRYLPTSVSGPSSLRYYHYLLEDIAILRNHLRESCGNERTFISQVIQKKVAEGAEKLYYHGRGGNRTLAAWFLMKLLARNPVSPMAAAFLVGLWCPDLISKRLGRPLWKLLSRKS